MGRQLVKPVHPWGKIIRLLEKHNTTILRRIFAAFRRIDQNFDLVVMKDVIEHIYSTQAQPLRKVLIAEIN